MKGIEFDPGDLGGDLCTIAGAVEGEARVSDYHLRRYAHVKVTAAPGAGPMFVSFEWLAREELPYAWMVDCEQGARTALAEPLADGRRVVLVRVSVVGGSYHDTDTDSESVRRAAVDAVRQALSTAKLVPL